MSETTADAKPVPPAEAEKKKEQSLPFFKLFSFADKFDHLLMITGSIGAIIHGSSMPVFFLLFGEMVNGFGKNQMDLHQMTHEVSKVKNQIISFLSFNFILIKIYIQDLICCVMS